MRHTIAALLVTAVAVVLLLNFKASPPQLTGTAPTTTTAAAPARTSAAKARTGAAAGGASGTATGELMQHQYGDVQVQATLRNGQLTDVQTVAIDGVDGHSQQIDSQAEPLLRAEALQARSGSIDTISGATYTSEAYIGSLQSAIDKVRNA
ncbi:MAG TPA: FMN-binding protein [Conexibacter sp.]|nr:FMN-binding protein [Conexibacter sp.]